VVGVTDNYSFLFNSLLLFVAVLLCAVILLRLKKTG
jgi:hypothetical protein